MDRIDEIAAARCDVRTPSEDTFVDRLSIPASEALHAAEREARELGHSSVGVVHVLLGLASTPGGAVRRALLRRGVLADELRARVSALLPPDDGPPIDLTHTPLERLVHAVHDDGLTHVISTTDLLRAVLAEGDRVTELVMAELGGGARLLYAAAGEEAVAPEPPRVVPSPVPPRSMPRRPAVAPATTQPEVAVEPVTEAFEVLLEIRGLLRALAHRQIDGSATPIEMRVAADIEAAVASARLRMSEDRRGGIGLPRADDLAQRRFVSALRGAYLDALDNIAADTALFPTPAAR